MEKLRIEGVWHGKNKQSTRNAESESFFHTLNGHVVHGSVFSTRKEANAISFDYSEIYYNQVRTHSANGWLSTEAFEQKYFKNLKRSVVHDTV